jgi:hypothetical protein
VVTHPEAQEATLSLLKLFPGALLPPGVQVDVMVTKRETRGTGQRLRTSAGSLDGFTICNTPKRPRWKRC